MKISRRVDGSVCSAVLSSRRRPSPTRAFSVTTVANASGGRFSFCSNHGSSAGSRRSIVRKSTTVGNGTTTPGSNFFCARTSLWLLSTFAPPAESRRTIRIPRSRDAASNAYSTAAAAAADLQRPAHHNFGTMPVKPDKKELSGLVGGGDDVGDVDEHLKHYRDPYWSGFAQPDGPELRVSERRQDVEFPSKEETFKINDETKQLISKLCMAIGHKLRHPQRGSLEMIYNTYLQLPEHRMLHLTWPWRDRLLKVMGVPAKRDTESMLRYFALVADVKSAGLTLRRSHWNYAIAYATKYTARVTAPEMESGLRLWREMERDAHIKGNEVTFNILFDVAAKAGNFTLADLIYKEMENRGLPFNRYHHVSLIHYFGLQLDSEGIRAAYKDMVEAGEMVDTLVLNCVISGLLRCGEEAAAEETYARMKNEYTFAPVMPERNYMMGKVITKVLMMFTKVGRRHPELGKRLQKRIELAPDLHTYRLLVEHYAIRVGDLTKVAQYLDEMKFLNINIHPTIFLALFKGFYSHGGFSGSEWSEQRLEGVLQALYQARDDNVRNFRIDRWLVVWALRAVKKCSSAEAVVEAFDDMAERWDIPGDRQPFIYSFLENITNGSDMKSSAGGWDGPLYRRHKKDGSRL